MVRYHRFSHRQLALSTIAPLLCLFATDLPQARSQQIAELLLRVFEKTEGFEWRNRDGWNIDPTDYCSWEGITCNTEYYSEDQYYVEDELLGQIDTINLSDNNLIGTLPQDIWEIPNLNTLDLRDNPYLDVDFTGIEKSTIQKLILSDTGVKKFGGLEDAKFLKELHLTECYVGGTIPKEIFSLATLEGFFANYNAFTGTIPADIAKLTELRELFLFENNLKGMIPDKIGELTKLRTLILSMNSLTGELPGDALNMLSNLQVLGLNRDEGNQEGGFKGPLPSLNNLNDLTELYIQNNLLTGEIPENFLWNAPKAEVVTVDITNNKLSGVLGAFQLDNFRRMNLYATGNSFDEIDPKLCNNGAWMEGDVDLFGCEAIACGKGEYAPDGRQTYYDDCLPCDEVQVIGAYECDSAANVQRNILNDFYYAVDGDNWENNDWVDDVHECDWGGITCNDNLEVTEINLNDNNLSGYPGSRIFLLPELQVLDLSDNFINFRFDGISEAKNLDSLRLYGTGLKSFDDVGQLAETSITELFLSANNLEGSIPDSIYNVGSIETLMISHNSLTGQLSPDIAKLTKLRSFRVYGNNLSGEIPSEIGLLKGLTELILSENDFTGEIPLELSNMPQIEEISIHQSSNTSGGLSGTLPDFAGCKSLSTLHLSSNSIHGPLPDDFLKFTTVRSIIDVNLSNNQITGAMPAAWDRLDNLRVDLTSNGIDSISSGLCSKGNWQSGNVEDFHCDAILCKKGFFNALGMQTGSDTPCERCVSAQHMGATQCDDDDLNDAIPLLKTLYTSTSGSDWKNEESWMTDPDVCNWYGVTCEGQDVVKIDMKDNGLSGTPSPELYKLSKLRELDLEKNDIDFNFQGIENAINLETLYLSQTQVTSLDGIGSAQKLKTLHLTNNYLAGEIPEEVYDLTNLEQLFMNYNQFSGRLSPKVGQLSNLEALYLTANQLTGQIPREIGDLQNLNILSLAENHLSGTIPEKINNLKNIKILSLQQQKGDENGSGLSGPLPSFNNLPLLQGVYLGYNDLTGTIPYEFLDGIKDKSESIEVELISNSLNGKVPSSLSQFDRLKISLADNDFDDLAPGLCSMQNWMDGEVGLYSCDSIMCPPDTSSKYGRRQGVTQCEDCPESTSAPFWGSLSCVSEKQASRKSEKEILEMLYTALDGVDWHSQDYWIDSDTSFCEWKGIKCTSDSEESVEAIRLPNNALYGEVPSSIFDLENLQEIDFSGNDITFNFASIGKAKNLKYLNLDATGMKIIEGLTDATSLLNLYISNNLLNDFPSEVALLDKLEVLDMSFNLFDNNEIPTQLKSLRGSLIFFQCNRCGFEGSIPEWFGDFEKLEYLSLSGNKLDGFIPKELDSISTLKQLDLSDQISRGGGLQGNLPSFASLFSLSELYLDKNKLEGYIPENFLLNVQVNGVRVDLRKNMLEGEVPLDLFDRFDDLTLLLANNEITKIPSQICDGNEEIEWNKGDMVDFGCDGLLCRPGYYNPLGRRTVKFECEECENKDFAKFYGSTACGANEQKEILEIFYYTLGGADWIQNDNWMDTENVCVWYGITCTSGIVTAIELGENELSGNVPTELFSLTSLVTIDLKSNDIIFSFEGIERLTKLETLALSNTDLTSIEGISAVKASLLELHLTDNSFATIPEELYNLTKLKNLYFNYNEMEGSLSPRIGDLTALENIYMFHNKISGPLPSEIGNLPELTVLALGGNYFTGKIPTSLSSMPNLEILALQRVPDSSEDSYRLTGDLPAFDNSPKIKELYLSDQDLSGTIPVTFLNSVDDKDEMMLVDLTMNSIKGSLPLSLKEFKNMNIYLGGNEIEDIDDSFCELDDWMRGAVGDVGCDAILCPRETYSIYGRQSGDNATCEPCPFTYTTVFWGSTTCSADAADYNEREILAIFYDSTGGIEWKEKNNWKEDSVSVCDWYGVHCASEDYSGGSKVVKQIHLPSNNLSGTVPPQIFGLTHLEMLNIRENPIDFEFHGIGEAEMLKELYLDSTNISDIDGIGEAKYLKTLHLQQNKFRGLTIPDELFDLKNLKHLYLSDGGFGGMLSPKFGNLSSLEDFYCHGNDLIGTIPTEIGQLKALEVLVLSENKFVGPIPNEINNLSHLQALYIDSFTRNNAGLSGPLPSFTGMPVLREIYLGANSLTGFFPFDFLGGLNSNEEKITIGLKSNRIEGVLPKSLSKFENFDIDISDNFITEIEGELCAMEKWNKGGVDKFKCNALLCPAGHFNQFGYQLNDRAPCKKCAGLEESKYLGATICQSEVKEKERKILEMLYHKCGGEDWKVNDNWLDENIDICNWYGISCRNGGTVDSILLGSNNLVGTPPKQLFELTNLKWLWLYSNPIKFSFHGIEKAERLTSLLLDSTGLESVDGIGNAYQLTDLDLRFNMLSGSLPDEIQNLVNLETLSLTQNYFTGTVPGLNNFHRLKTLRLDDNNFSGPLLDFSTHVKLKTLDLSGNTITGIIPSTLLSSVSSDEEIFLDLSSNRLRGKVPGELKRFEKMTLLLRDNFLEGIDPELCGSIGWNDGDVNDYECDGLLCPPGTFAEAKGRASKTGTQCTECKEAKFYGQSQCIDLVSAYRTSSCSIRLHWFGVILALSMSIFLSVHTVY